MSEFMAHVRKFEAAMLASDNPTAEARQQIEVGRTFATLLIDEVRSGRCGEDTLICAIGAVGGSSGTLLRGFLREISDAVKEGIR